MTENKTNEKQLINRRQLLKTFGIGIGALAITNTTSKLYASKIVPRSSVQIVEFSDSMLELPGGWSFLRKMFDIKNSFWRGVGAVAISLLTRGTGLEGFDFGLNQNRQYPQIKNFNEQQAQSGWQIPQTPNTPVFEIPQNNLAYPLNNGQPQGFREVVAANYKGGKNIVSMPPAALLALNSYLKAVKAQCPCLTPDNLTGLFVPQKTANSVESPYLGGNFYGKYATQYGAVKIWQTPRTSRPGMEQSELMISVENEWGPENINSVLRPNAPMNVRYSVDDVNVS